MARWQRQVKTESARFVDAEKQFGLPNRIVKRQLRRDSAKRHWLPPNGSWSAPAARGRAAVTMNLLPNKTGGDGQDCHGQAGGGCRASRQGAQPPTQGPGCGGWRTKLFSAHTGTGCKRSTTPLWKRLTTRPTIPDPRRAALGSGAVPGGVKQMRPCRVNHAGCVISAAQPIGGEFPCVQRYSLQYQRCAQAEQPSKSNARPTPWCAGRARLPASSRRLHQHNAVCRSINWSSGDSTTPLKTIQ